MSIKNHQKTSVMLFKPYINTFKIKYFPFMESILLYIGNYDLTFFMILA